MKECNKVFFGEKGITSTSANHLANLAKECMESNRRALEGVGFITSTVRLLNGGEAAILTEGRNEQYLSSVPELLKEIAEMKMPDLNAANVEAAMNTIAGTARSMGIKISE